MKVLKFCALTLVLPLFLSAYSSAESFSFTGTAGTGNDQSNINLTGISFLLYSGSPGGQGSPLFMCTQGTVCQVPSIDVGTFESFTTEPGEFSGGTIDGIKADSLTGGITFSGTSFVLGSDPNNLGSGQVSFSGNIKGFVFTPVGCEMTDAAPPCVEAQVFNVHLTGTGTVTLFGEPAGDNGLSNIDAVGYTLTGTATVVPEPSTLLMFAAGIPGVLGLRHWRYRTRSRTS